MQKAFTTGYMMAQGGMGRAAVANFNPTMNINMPNAVPSMSAPPTFVGRGVDMKMPGFGRSISSIPSSSSLRTSNLLSKPEITPQLTLRFSEVENQIRNLRDYHSDARYSKPSTYVTSLPYVPQPVRVFARNIHIPRPALNDEFNANNPEEEGDRQLGTVKWFDPSKGYGFIVSDDGSDIFVHFTNIIGDGYRTLSDGQRVEFQTAEGRKGITAVDVASADE